MEEQQIIKDALTYVKAAGGVGVDKARLMSAVKTIDGLPLSPEQKDYVFGLLETRGWITYHLDPLWHAKRWTITPSGMTALDAM